MWLLWNFNWPITATFNISSQAETKVKMFQKLVSGDFMWEHQVQPNVAMKALRMIEWFPKHSHVSKIKIYMDVHVKKSSQMPQGHLIISYFFEEATYDNNINSFRDIFCIKCKSCGFYKY